MNPIIWLIVTVLQIYFWILVATVVASWLVAFNIVNRHNDVVRQILLALSRLSEPVLAPIRRMMPNLGGLDISPIIVAIIIQFLEYAVVYYGSRLF